MRVLIVEDNIRLAALLAERLDVQGFSCDQADCLESATRLLGGDEYDIVILDLGLPDGDGLEWLGSQRAIRRFPPTVILSARNALGDRVAGLDGGAEDYLVKPFEFDELLARLRVLTRRSMGGRGAVITVGSLHFDVEARSANLRGLSMQMSRREADLLELLMRQSGKVVPRARIEDALYSSGEAVTPNAVEAVMSRLRRKIESCGGAGMLHTIRGLGYMLRAEHP